MAGLLDGKVAIITGAGGGIGRCYAHLFAREGARVVVNDLGGSLDGTGQTHNMADKVVAEIKELGGQAVANYASVSTKEGADSIVKTALDTWGRADILINNAGILRDKSFLKMEEGMWDLVIAVHLKGTYLCSQAFALHAKERADKGDRGGRIVNTSSYAGLKGNFGQTNYSAAKAGIYGLTLTWSMELAKLGVTVNCIAPMAKTRMTEDITAVPDNMQPEQIAPMALFLASDLAANVNGRVFGVHGQQLLEYKMLMTEGVTKPGQDLWTAQEIARHIEEIGATGPAPAPAGGAAAAPITDAQIIATAFQLMPQVFVPEKAAGWTANIQFDITGGQPWTVEIAGGKCTTKQGKQGTPTCVVTVDEKTYSAVVQGKEKAEQAFMAGKIKATNLGDMMKFGAAFDMKKARALAEQARPAAAPAGGAAGGAAAGPLTDGQVIAAAFQLMPQVFVPEKAAGWTANVQFDITGGTPWTVEVAGGKCTTREGKHGTPTCVVTVDEKTYAAVVQGKEKAEQAFMAGKIKATNLGDMMKFGAAFDMKKARALAEQAGPAAATTKAAAAPAAGGGAGDPQALLARAFELMPAHFKPEGASGWTAALGFQIAGGEDWTLEVKDGKAASRRGMPANPTCTVSTSLADLAAVLSGELKAEQAFMQGKLKASNLGDMMKFGRAFDLKAVAGELRKGGAPSGGAAAAGGARGGMNRDVIGKVHRGGEPIFLHPEWCAAYARATQDENPAYLDPKHKGGVLAPPMVAVRIAKDALFRAVTDEELGADMLRLVHGEQDMEWFHPLRPWDLCATRSEVTAIEAKSTGEVLTTDGRIYVGGQLACRVRSSMFIRDPNAKKGEKKEAAAPTARPTPLVSKKITVQPDQSVRYTEASLDNNPIHTDPEIAKMAGFKGVILHGLCTMAFAGKTVVDELCGRDPTKLRRLAVRFSRPVYMTDTLTVEIWPADATQGRKAFGLRVINQDGDEVITNGMAEIDG